MTEWKARRFWTEAGVAPIEGGWQVTLDGRPVRTPGKLPLCLPTEAMAQALAAEWEAQKEHIDPTSMPFTRAANSAIEKVIPQFDAVVDMLSDYGDSDLLCYRAESPAELVARQAEGWDPLLDWAADRLGARLRPVPGVMHQPQDPAALDALDARLRAMDAFQITAMSDLVSISGSLVLGLATCSAHLSAERAFDLSRIDEIWQQDLWGVDDEAARVTALKRADYLRAQEFFALTGSDAGF